MNKNLSLVRKAQKRFQQFNQMGFDGCLPKIKIEVKTYSNDSDGYFLSFFPDTKPQIVLYKNVDDKILLHEMVHYYLYTLYLPVFKLSGQTPADSKKFMRKYQHTKEFWDVLREVSHRLI